ncbi:MAG: DNA translocase FtsK 4TM domain-containing protein [Nitrospirae bacterium]|nr:DNA translocase FtsK 4TM domain-containing protein [Nitrospirota bacterium]
MPISGMPRERVQEILGVTAAMASLLVAVSLLSHTAADPSLFSSSHASVRNLAGRVGANLSEALFQLIGAGAYLLPILGGLAAWNGLVQKRRLWSWSNAAGAGLLVVSAAALTALYLPDGEIYGGGFVGDTVAGLLLDAFAWWGTSIIVVASALLALLILTPLSLRDFGSRAAALVSDLRARASSLFVVRRERTRRKQAAPPPRRVNTPSAPPRIAETPGPPAAPARQEALAFMRSGGSYQLPPLSLLADPVVPSKKAGKDELVMSSRLLEKKLFDFGVEGTVTEVHPGPIITMYEVELVPGLKVSKVLNLADDLALAMKAPSVRIVSPLPGKSAIGIEIPNQARESVALKEILSATEFLDGPSKLPLALGKDIFGQPVVADLAAMPHLLVAGATGSGKSVALNTMILSLLYAASPRDVRLLMIDPKMLELSAYDAIPHLLTPVVTQPKDAAAALLKVVAEMQRRYRLLAEAGVRNIEGYNKQVGQPQTVAKPATGATDGPAGAEPPAQPPTPLPYIVVVIDELADLMMVAAREVEDSIMRLAQMARAAGIHLILATQRPSVDVLTGVIKANFPARISFQVSSKTDSRTILDANGAEQLLGRGDMLYLVPGTGRITRIHGAYVSEAEIAGTVDFIKAQAAPTYDWSLEEADATGMRGGEDPERDDLYGKAIELVATTGQASASFIQRRLRVGYPRAARMIEMMEEDQIVGPASGGKPREVLVRRAVPGGDEV